MLKMIIADNPGCAKIEEQVCETMADGMEREEAGQEAIREMEWGVRKQLRERAETCNI